MPKRTDIKKILIIGSGPIIISQACEFDYSGTQACKALREEGFEVVLINSNPATIMTDPEMADRTYIEPITPEMVCQVIERERPDAILPTLGGQTGLNCAIAVADTGILERLGVEMIGANPDVIKKAEDRELFRDAMTKIGLRVPRSAIVRTIDEAVAAAPEIGYPIIVRPSFTLGGTGGGIAYNLEDLKDLSSQGLEASMITEVMLEESALGWKEYELEVMRDFKDNVVIICSIENLDPMGAYRRFHHRGPGSDPDGPGIPTHAGCLFGHHAGNRGGDRRLQHPVRGAPGYRRDGGHRDESPGVPVVGPGLQGHGFPHCQDCRQTGGGLHFG